MKYVKFLPGWVKCYLCRFLSDDVMLFTDEDGAPLEMCVSCRARMDNVS